MRGNNIHFSNAVAHHEMIPGHNLVGFMGQRFNGYRSGLGGTPFLGEGWPLYWETILYDKGFFDTPEKRIGSLFWRMHRAARIVFSRARATANFQTPTFKQRVDPLLPLGEVG